MPFLVNKIGANLLEAWFPHYCLLCGLRSYRPVPLCLDCESEMPVNQHGCVRCAIPLPARAGIETAQHCGACLRQPPAYDRVIAPWLYDEYLAHLIHRWKFHGEQRLTRVLAALWLQRVEPGRRPVDTVVPVPLHWRRGWQRGFNQAELLGREILATSPHPGTCQLTTKLARRRLPTVAQSGINARLRSRNLQGAFTVSGRCDNLRVAIVDDVLTTGATAAALAKELRAAGADYIEVWCLARTPAPGG
jgi:ComF family protein